MTSIKEDAVKLSRLSIAWLMSGVVIVAVGCAILGSHLRGRPLLGSAYCLDVGLLPTVSVLGIVLSGMFLPRGQCGPFSLGFVTFGGLAVLGYIIGCRTIPDIVAMPILYYLNEVEPRFMEADTLGLYTLSLIFRGLILGLPQLLIALAGGLLARRIFKRRAVAPPPRAR